MSDRDALFQAILAAPEDDAPRLVYADWLDEHGDPDRAEFIRVQCRLARLPFYEPEYAALKARAAELHVRHITEWRFDWLPPRQVFRRGFVEELTLPADLFVQNARALFEQMPLRWAHFTYLPGGGSWTWDLVAPLEGIEFPYGPFGGPDHWSATELPRLRWLKARGLEAVAAFLRTFACPRLEALDLSESNATPPELEDFIRQADLTRLQGFALDAAGDDPHFAHRLRAAGARLVAAAGMTRLRQLHLRGQLVGEAGLFHLSRPVVWDELEELYLERNDIGLIGPTGIEDLCSSTGLPGLRALSLADNPIGAAGVADLAVWPGLRRLRWLDLSGCGLTDAAVWPLAESPYLHGGLGLCLHDNPFDPASRFPAGLLRGPTSVS